MINYFVFFAFRFSEYHNFCHKSIFCLAKLVVDLFQITQVVPHKYPLFAYALTAREAQHGEMGHNVVMPDSDGNDLDDISFLHIYAYCMHFVLFVKLYLILSLYESAF